MMTTTIITTQCEAGGSIYGKDCIKLSIPVEKLIFHCGL